MRKYKKRFSLNTLKNVVKKLTTAKINYVGIQQSERIYCVSIAKKRIANGFEKLFYEGKIHEMSINKLNIVIEGERI